MDERNGGEKMEDIIMLPGFRFHPTDEELVGFYLKKKTQQRTLSIELIKQLDIYKYDPWDLPKLASSTGEKEWYFYCPRDRKYKNSTRPNRVTGSGFWKATGTDRPIYSCEGSKCIGLKKSLVFYKGRAAKGLKTDWMMHEFRLPSTTNTGPSKPNDSWAICRIFKKASSVTQRALSHARLFGSDSNYILSTARESSVTQYGLNVYDLPHSYSTSFCPIDQVASTMNSSTSNVNAFEQNQSTKSTADALLKTSSSVFGDFGGVSESLEYSEMQALYDSCSMKLPQEYVAEKQHDVQWEDVNFNVDLSEFGFGFLECDSSSTCPSEISATYYSTSKAL